MFLCQPTFWELILTSQLILNWCVYNFEFLHRINFISSLMFWTSSKPFMLCFVVRNILVLFLYEFRSGQYVWEDHRPRSGVWKGTSGGEAISFSGCDDDQTSIDTSVKTQFLESVTQNFSCIKETTNRILKSEIGTCHSCFNCTILANALIVHMNRHYRE